MRLVNDHPNHKTVDASKPGDKLKTFYCLECKVDFQTGALRHILNEAPKGETNELSPRIPLLHKR